MLTTQPVITRKYLGHIQRQFLGDEYSRGWLYLAAYDNRRWRSWWVQPRDVLGPTMEWVERMNRGGCNIYASWALYSTKEKERSFNTLLATCAYVADWDVDEPEIIEGLSPTFTVETSPGRYQEVFVHKPLELEEAKEKYTALTRRLGCDNISSDPSHVWRVPGTVNWASPKKKRAPSLSKWNGAVNGKVVLPGVLKAIGAHVEEWPSRRRGNKLTRAQRANLNRRVLPGDRSDQFHALVMSLAEGGWGIEDIAEKLKGKSVADKFADRLIAEIKRSIGKSGLTPPAKAKDAQLIWYNPEDVERKIDFLWYPYIPKGEVTFLDGDGGIGKTSLMLKVAQAVIDGDTMPNEEKVTGGGKVLYISLESDYYSVTLPILKRMGVKHRGRFAHLEEGSFSMDEAGLEMLEGLLTTHKFDLVVIDSLVDFLPEELEMNDYKQSSQMVLGLRARIALTHNCAVVALRHNTKASQAKLSYRGIGSQGWAKGARSQLVVRDDPDIDGQYIIAHTKHNLSKKGPSITYQFKEINQRGVIEWVDVSDVSDEELNDPKINPDRKSQKAEIMTWLRDILRGRGPLDTRWIYEQADAKSWNHRYVRAASVELGVVKSVDRQGHGSLSTWELDK